MAKAKKASRPPKQNTRQSMRRQLQEHRLVSVVYIVLRIFVIATAVFQFLNKDYNNVFLCILTLILFMIPSFVEKRIKIDVPDAMEIIILLFIFSAEILGEIQEYYLTFPYWDTVLHTLNGFLAAAIGFSLIDILNRSEKFAISLSPLFVSMVAFCFSMTIGVLWEFFEYGMDFLFLTDMQKDTYIDVLSTVLLHPEGRNTAVVVPVESVIINGQTWAGYIDIGLHDTIADMFVNFLGAAFFSCFGFVCLKVRGKKQFFPGLILTRISDENQDPPPCESTAENSENEINEANENNES